MVTLQEETTRLQFFEFIFGDATGWLEIATKAYNSNRFEQTYFRWPQQAREMLAFIDSRVNGYNIWFCTSLLSIPNRNKGNITECTCLWADLDSCSPDNLENPKPNIVVQSSLGRYQALWSLDAPCPPTIAEEYARRIAYKYAEYGADIGTWNLGRLLRVPFTFNYKYVDRKVELLTCIDLKYPIELFDVLPEAGTGKSPLNVPLPDPGVIKSADEVISTYQYDFPPYFFALHQKTPDDGADWSELFWKELMVCFETGLTLEETYAVALESACNKFIRDEREDSYTWSDVVRAHQTYIQNSISIASPEWTLPTLVSQADIPTEPTFVERYVTWAAEQTDAPVEYHQLSACIILSSLLAKTVRLPTSMGVLRPNLWGMILADTTLTRKTTAMDMATDLLDDALPDTVVATDGSVEGLLSALSTRNGSTSMFKRDEFTGLMEQMVKKDYMSGMLEMFTQLYDGKRIKRLLKKETIEVNDPIFIMFVGGIREKMQTVLKHEHLSSGFIPRFLVVSAESDIKRVKPLSRRSEQSTIGRTQLVQELIQLRERYVDDIMIVTELGSKMMAAPEVEADLTDDAWEHYNSLELKLIEAGVAAHNKEYMTPVLDRMAKSLLKLAVIVSACRQVPEHGKLEVTKADVNRAAGMIQVWAQHMVDLVGKVGLSAEEKYLGRVMDFIRNHEGCMRSDIMRQMHFNAFTMEGIQKTLEMRGLIRVEKKGKGLRLWTL